MRTNLTLEDVKGIVEAIYNGNLKQSRISGGSIPYENENSEKIALYDEHGRALGEKDIAEHLNLHFYTWRNRVVDSEAGETYDLTPEGAIDAWVKSLNGSLNDAYALVEITNTTAVASQDIDGAQITGRVTIIIQANKVANLDYYAGKIHNKYLGAPQDIINSYGDTLKAYINMGIILYESEPVTMQLGECVIVAFNFTINYLADAFSYADTDISFCVGVDPDEMVENPLNIHYEKLPLTKASLVSAMTYSAVPYAEHPDLAGVINTAHSLTWTLAFLDFKQPLIEKLDALFWGRGSLKYSVNNGIWENQHLDDLNEPFYAKIKVKYSDGDEIIYKYSFVITEMRKEVVNGDFNICTLTLRGRSKDPTPYWQVI